MPSASHRTISLLSCSAYANMVSSNGGKTVAKAIRCTSLIPAAIKLEAHVGDLDSRLAQCRAQPCAGMRFFD
jgi:hypothetical protein